MIEILSWLNNRELALLFWLSVAILITLISKQTRPHFLNIIKLILTTEICTVLLFCIAYSITIVYLVQKVGFWEMSLSKDVILWLFGFAFYNVLKINKEKSQVKYFRDILFDLIKLLVVVQFITGVYVLSFVGELILIPLLVIVLMLIITSENMSEKSKGHGIVLSFLNLVLIVILTYTLVQCLIGLFTKPLELFSLIKLKEFIAPIILTLLFMPLLYSLYFYMFYQKFTIRLMYLLKKNNKLLRYAKVKLLIKSRLSIDKLIILERKLLGESIDTRKEFDQRLSQ